MSEWVQINLFLEKRFHIYLCFAITLFSDLFTEYLWSISVSRRNSNSVLSGDNRIKGDKRWA